MPKSSLRFSISSGGTYGTPGYVPGGQWTQSSPVQTSVLRGGMGMQASFSPRLSEIGAAKTMAAVVMGMC